MQQQNSLVLSNLGCSFHFWDVNCPAVPALHTDKSIIKQWLDTVNSHKTCSTKSFCTFIKAK